MTTRRILAAAVIAAVVIAAAIVIRHTLTSRDRQAAPRPDIVLITIDTLRADRVGRGLTPAIDGLAARGVTFRNARTAVPLTLPSHVTIMTGTLPPVHGVRQNGVVLRGGRPPLARVLRNAGFRTGAFVGAYVLDRRFGLAEGFELYDDRVPRDPEKGARLEAERRGGEVVDAALQWLLKIPEPFFAWIHLYDPHAPYEPPAEFLAKAGGQPYDGEVAYADAQVARVVEALRQRGSYERTLIAVAGDHGEGLGEHGEQTHGMLAYDSTLRVPLVIVAPGQTKGTNDEPVSLADLAGSLLTIADVQPPDGMSSAFLLSRRTTDRDVYAESEYPRAAGWHPIAALADARWKLVLTAEPELYDLTADPGELRNIAAEKAALVQGMSARVKELARPPAGAPAPGVDPEAAQRLRALGYVSGSASDQRSARGPNPARVIHEWQTFEQALALVNGGRARDALSPLKKLTATFPDSSVFQSTYARAQMEAGNPRAAMAIYRGAVARHAGDAMLFHDLAAAARAAGDPVEALRAEQAALALDNDNPVALNGLGLIHADAGRSVDAASAFYRAASLDRFNPSYWTNLGNAHRELGDLKAAETAYRRALQADENYPDALNGLGVVLVQRGSPAEAVPLLTRALERAPDFHEARLNLGIAYQESGDKAKAAEIYRSILADAPARAVRERQAASDLLRRLR